MVISLVLAIKIRVNAIDFPCGPGCISPMRVVILVHHEARHKDGKGEQQKN
jgi:hypothetical protein